MTPRDRTLLALIVPAVLAAGVWFLLLAPQRKEAERLDTEIAAAQTRMAAVRGDLERNQAARRDLKANVTALAGAARAVPATAGVPALLRELERTARTSDVEMRSITTAGAAADGASPAAAGAAPASTANPGMRTVDITLTFEGRYFALRRMLARIHGFVERRGDGVRVKGRLVSVRGVDLSASAGGLTAQAQASIYVLPEVKP